MAGGIVADYAGTDFPVLHRRPGDAQALSRSWKASKATTASKAAFMQASEVTSMSGEEIVALSKRHTIFEWSAQSKVDPIPMARAQGIYFWTPEGKRYIDFNSQLMCVNIGHGDERVVRAIQEQAAVLAYANPFMATEPRARLGAKLAELTPGDIDAFFFTNGGAEANENAIKIARWITGRHKILAFYRSYHGATAAFDLAHRRPAPLGRGARNPGRRAPAQPLPRHHARMGFERRCAGERRRNDSARGREHHRGAHPRAGCRHQRRARAARRLHPGTARALRSLRHPDDCRRGHGGIRPHGPMVFDRSLGRGARPDHDGERADLRLRPTGRRRDAPRHRRSLPRQRLLRRPHLQQPSAGLRVRARHHCGHGRGSTSSNAPCPAER